MRTIESVNSQNHDVELIVVDGGSTDGGLKILKDNNISNIKLISQSNKGVSSARNKGVEASSHDLIAFIDADDEWLPNYLDIIDDLVMKYPKAGAYATSFQYKYESKTVPKKANIHLKPPFIGIPDFFKCIREREFFCTSSIVLRKGIFNEIGGFKEDMWYGEDTDAWVRLALVSNIAYSSEVGMNYHQDEANRAMKLRRPVTNHFIDSVNEHLRTHPEVDPNLLSFANRHLCLVALKNIGNGYSKEARELLSRRPSNKEVGFVTLCYLLSISPRLVSSNLFKLWDLVRTN